MVIKLFPKKVDFLALLLEQAQKTQEGISALYEFIQDPKPEKGKKVEEIESEADEMRRILIAEINRAAPSVVEPVDVFALSRAIDDTIDYAKTTVEEMMLFEVKPDEHIKKMVEALLNASNEIVSALKVLRSHPSVCSEHLIKVKKTENYIEHRYREALVELFKSEDIKKILKMREIYRHLSNAADRADETANLIGNILVKMAWRK